jgi:hypothetical protein
VDKKTECEIVQDLLFGYADEVLNTQSKKLVEKHLLECEECRSKFNEIKKDIESNENNQKRQIDYLKKIRRKNFIKSVLISIGIIFSIVFIFYLRKFIIINNLMNKAKQSIKSNNFYRETIQGVTKDITSVKKEWYKDGKYKTTTEIYSDNGVKKGEVIYATVNSDEQIIINSDSKKVIIQRGEGIKRLNNEMNIKYGNSFRDYRFKTKIEWALNYSIRKSNRDIGREYYVLNKLFEKDSNYEIWVDKDTGLTLKEKGDTIVKELFKGTDIVKEEYELSSRYKCEFDIVTDEDVQVPDYTGYEIKYINRDNKL